MTSVLHQLIQVQYQSGKSIVGAITYVILLTRPQRPEALYNPAGGENPAYPTVYFLPWYLRASGTYQN